MINNQFKDATIKLFLKEKDSRLIRLINSIRNTNYPEDTPISDNTLETPVFMAAHNDLSFCYDNDINLVLIEHQSTINENMAVRLLMYLGRVYEEILKSSNIYATKRIPIPAPYLIVLYNGTAECPEERILRLSDAFQVTNTEVEVLVHMYNINYNEDNMPRILEQNPDLKEYAAFIQAVREYSSQGHEIEEAIKKAIFDFRETAAMGPFLEANGSEVLSVLMAEWNTEDFGRVQRAEGRQEGKIDVLCQLISRYMHSMNLSFDGAVKALQYTADEIALCRPHFIE